MTPPTVAPTIAPFAVDPLARPTAAPAAPPTAAPMTAPFSLFVLSDAQAFNASVSTASAVPVTRKRERSASCMYDLRLRGFVHARADRVPLPTVLSREPTKKDPRPRP